jgi:hypothetical protein
MDASREWNAKVYGGSDDICSVKIESRRDDDDERWTLSTGDVFRGGVSVGAST